MGIRWRHLRDIFDERNGVSLTLLYPRRRGALAGEAIPDSIA